jgi:hypothetical protein
MRVRARRSVSANHPAPAGRYPLRPHGARDHGLHAVSRPPAALAILCGIRVAIPLAVLAASGSRLPSLPPYDYNPLPGDAHGFYSAAREFIASWGRLGPVAVVAMALGLVALAVWTVRAWRSRTSLRPWLVVVCALAVSLAVTVAVTQTGRHTGAAVFGWPLVWALPMLPYRAVGLPLDPDVAFVFGLVIALAAEAVILVATWLVGLRATGSRGVALLAAGLYAVWPLLSGFLSGDHGGMNGSWFADAGLCGCTEPVSTALVGVATALVLAPALTPLVLATIGVLLSFATVVRLSNGIIALLLLGLLLHRLGGRKTLPFAAGALTFAPVAIAWWPRGYAALFDRPDVWPANPFSIDHVVSNWTDSLFFSVPAALVLVPIAVAGAVTMRRRWALAVLLVVVVSTAVFYSFYANTGQHPRFFLVALPAFLVIWAAGAATLFAGGMRIAGHRASTRATGASHL